ncbi:hypothetical protein [Puerhibacterium sp. TATVAM-FAB25]
MLGETASPLEIAGGVLVVGGVLLGAAGPRRRASTAVRRTG